jgi:lipopolysaccharide export LptBFGC system permease protein LptF
MTVSLGSKKALDDFGQTASLPMTFLHHAGALAFVPVFVALLVSAGCFLNPRCSVRTLAVGACLLAGAAVVLAAVMAVIVLEFSKLIADLR